MVYLAPRIADQAKGRLDGILQHGLSLDDRSGHPWDDVIDTLPVHGSYMSEIVFFHRSSRTLVLTDMIENFEPQALIADKAYDSDTLIESVTAKGILAVIPPKKSRLVQRQYDEHLYRERHLIECFINKIKHYRRVFSRFDKLSKNYLGFLSFVSALVWLR